MSNQFVRTDDIELATHWIPLEDNRWDYCNFTPGRPYKLKSFKSSLMNMWGQNVDSEEFLVEDDDGVWQTPWSIHKGYFVKGLDS